MIMKSAAPTSPGPAPLDWHHTTRSVPQAGLSHERAATPDELQRLASAIDAIAVEYFKAAYTLKPASGAQYLFDGTLTARLTQACVVTLEPVNEHLNESFSVIFAPAGAKEPVINDHESKAAPVLELPDIEPFTGDTLDVGRVLFELFSASIDPYPRKENAEFTWPGDGDTKARESTDNPFAALAKLKPKT
jgi:uncharacterized metal-binding protein YceD (DUF177 family)